MRRMPKMMITLKKKEMLPKTLPFVDAYLFGIEGFSVNEVGSFSIEEVKNLVSLLKEKKKQIFISLNKNMFSKDLEPLENVLEAIEKLHIDGIAFYDVSIPSIMKRRGFLTPLLWSQEHFTTNYATMNYWHEFNVLYTQLSCEITTEEIKEIRKNTNMKLIAQVFGYVPMFYSKRPFISNYKKTFSIKEEGVNYFIEKAGEKYPIKEEGDSTEVYTSTVLNAYLEMEKLEVDYLFFSSFAIEEEKFIEVLRCYRERDKEGLEKLYPFHNGFFNTKTVYRVRDL